MAFAQKSAWAKWLKDNHGTSTGVRLRLAKKASGLESVSSNEAVNVALCYEDGADV